MYDIVCAYSDRVQDGREFEDIYKHAAMEMVELRAEILYAKHGFPEGEDGIVGEAIDVIACMLDLIRKHDPFVTQAELEDYIDKKCQKWERKSIERNR